MVEHLKENISNLKNFLSKDGKVLDIGSNDGTSLSFYPEEVEKVGVDPSGKRFINNYPVNSILIPEFFDEEIVLKFNQSNKYFDIITSFAMFYDLPDSVHFAGNIEKLLSNEGVWCLEQSYLSAMIKQNAFDTICHEHIEYYCFSDLKKIFDKVGLKALDVTFNETNGVVLKFYVVRSPLNINLRKQLTKQLIMKPIFFK